MVVQTIDAPKAFSRDASAWLGEFAAHAEAPE
jgi:hypothetical protein